MGLSSIVYGQRTKEGILQVPKRTYQTIKNGTSL
jgi:predicted RecA/RadA family phage recombinase